MYEEEIEYITRVDVNIAILREIERINFREKLRRLMPMVARELFAAGVDFSKVDFSKVTDASDSEIDQFTFIQADALRPPVELSYFDAIHASPPCQFGSEATPMWARETHENLIPATREMLERSGKPFVIENVENVRKHLNQALMLCGTMVGLPIWRHRYFEVHPFITALTPPCVHDTSPITIHSGSYSRKLMRPILCTGGGDGKRANRKTHRPREAVANIRIAMEIPWMTQSELSQAIPPAYTEWIGKRLLEAIS